ncbi:MAG: MFS transporter, partial [Myxococcota bacterium]
LIADYFPPARRATAMAIYSLGIPIGGGIGFLAGGWLDELFDWRTAFIVVGVPGVLLALLVKLTLQEPERGAYDGASEQSAPAVSLGQAIRFMYRLKSFRHLSIAAALHAFYGYGSSAFLAAFFRRSHDMDPGELGTWFAAIALTGGAAGTFLGGFLGDRLGARDKRWYMWTPALATAIFIPFAVLLYLWSEPYVALLLYFPGSVLGGMYLGPTFAMTQSLVPVHMRATASAILLFIINLIGLGLGPQSVGILSDLLAASFDNESLRYALLIVVTSFAAWSVIHYLCAARTLRQDLELRVSQA